MRNLRIGLFQRDLSKLSYQMGLNFNKILNLAGAELVLPIYYSEIHQKYGHTLGSNIIKDIASKNNLDVLFFCLDFNFEFSPLVFNELKRKYFLVLYVGDDEHIFNRSAIYYAQSFDLVLTPCPFTAYRYQLYEINAKYMTEFFDELQFGLFYWNLVFSF